MKKSLAMPLMLSALLLSGCSSEHTTSITDANEKVMTIGDVSVTKGQEYDLLKTSNGPVQVITMAQNVIYDKEVPVNEEMKKQAEDQFKLIAENNEKVVDQIVNLGYKDKQDYIDKVLLPSVQAQALMKKYFVDDAETIELQYKPSIAQVIQCDTKENANQALQALKDGKTAQEVAEQYGLDSSSYTGSEELVTTNDSALPTRLINALNSASEAGVMPEVYETEDSNTAYYVAVLVSNDYDENVDRIADTLGSDSSMAKSCLVYYLTKYDFEVFDQELFDYYKQNTPEYLVTHPDLMETAKETD
ncbi:hypothetical protein [Dubosiella newyorkensis]|uniref:hypothetical protein n=1 Tax=Dubosiella newyorkensis TaxID=1862672 RepID=UPI0023EF9B9A|nr:hypothetical protein [Dubosiella newyorkensis]